MQPIVDFCNDFKNWFVVDWNEIKIQMTERGPYQKFLEKFGPLLEVQKSLGDLKATNLNDNPAVFTMTLPKWLGSQEVTILDLSQFKLWFSWGKVFLRATLWIGFGMWVLQEFKVHWHVG